MIINSLCWAQARQVDDIRKISELKEQIDTYYYEDFDSVQRICKEIIRLSQRDNLILPRLVAIYDLCYCANQHGRTEEFQSYVLLGNQLLKDYDAELRRIDTTGINRASMINVTGIYYYNLGNYIDAIAAFTRIVTFGGTPLTRDRSVLRSACNYLGQSYHNLGSLDKSLQYFELGNRYIQKGEEDYNYLHAMYYMYQAEYQFSVGLIQDAFASLKNSLQMLGKEKDISFVRNSLISNLRLIAHFYQRAEEYDSAIYYVKKAIALHIKNDPGIPGTYRFLGDIYYKHGKPDSALSYYTKSLNLSNQKFKDRHFTKSAALIGIGNVYRDRKLFDQAEGMYKEGLNNLLSNETIYNINSFSSVNLSTLIMPAEGMRVLLEQARLFYSWFQNNGYLGYLDSCIAMLGKALLLNDISRRELINIETKESKALLQTRITDLGVEASYKAFELSSNSAYLMNAFAFMEKSKGNILLDQVNEVSAKKFSGIPEDIQAKESRLKGELSVNKDRLLRAERSDEGYDDIKAEYDDKLREYMSLISELEQEYPRYFKLKYDVKTEQVKEVQGHLASNRTLLIQYFIGNDKIYMVGITKKQVIMQVTERNDEFDLNLYTLLKQLGNPDIIEVENDISIFREFNKTGRYLYNRILSPVLQELKSPVKELIIIPDGYLSYLPFEVLLTKETNIQEPDYSLLPYLIKEYQISYDYSASLIIENVDVRQKTWKSYVGYAPAYSNNINVSTGAPRQFNLSSLYANKDEIEACKKIWKGVSISGKMATEKSFRDHSSKINILHLATHTYLDDDDPQRSCFAFTRDGQSSEDGLLYTYELYNMNILAKLAILSGCETGIGHIKKGEGIISLARAFKFAGCPNIIMSLWKVNDQTTKEIMITFNKLLKKGMEKDRALQQAKVAYLQGSKNLHPAFWSSFVIIGNDDPIQRSGKAVLYFLIVFCTLFLIVLIRKNILRHRY